VFALIGECFLFFRLELGEVGKVPGVTSHESSSREEWDVFRQAAVFAEPFGLCNSLFLAETLYIMSKTVSQTTM
jgi:hypothetical protein